MASHSVGKQRLTSPPPLQPRKWADDVPAHPNNSVHTNHQQQMLTELKLWGHIGLARAIYRYAKVRNDDESHSSWKWIIDDWEQHRFEAFTQLCTVSELMLQSLIRNTIMHDAQSNETIREDLHRRKMPSKTPGIYASVLCQPESRDPALAGHIGKWLCNRDIEYLIRDYLAYIERNPAADQLSITFDEYLPPDTNSDLAAICNDPRQRRYAPSKKSLETIQEWANATRRYFIDPNIHQSMVDVPHSRAPMEVGWSIDLQSRLTQDVNKASTTYLFDYVNCWIRHRKTAGVGGDDFGPPVQFKLFDVWDHDTLPQVSEILGSILCSSYHLEAGYNCTYAGGMRPQLDDSKFKGVEEDVFGSSSLLHINLRLNADKLQRMDTVAKTDIQQLQHEHGQLVDKVNAARHDLTVAKAELARLKDHEERTTAEAYETGERAADARDKHLWKVLKESNAKKRAEKARQDTVVGLARDIWAKTRTRADLDEYDADIQAEVLAHMKEHEDFAASFREPLPRPAPGEPMPSKPWIEKLRASMSPEKWAEVRARVLARKEKELMYRGGE